MNPPLGCAVCVCVCVCPGVKTSRQVERGGRHQVIVFIDQDHTSASHKVPCSNTGEKGETLISSITDISICTR